MAKAKGKPAPAAAADGAADAPKGGAKKKLLIGLAALVLVGGGVGVYLKFGKSDHGAEHVAEAKKPVAFVDVREMTVNLASEPNADRPRFLKFKVALEVKESKIAADVQPLLPRVEDIFQVFVRELRPSDLEGSGGIHRLREELLRRVNIAVAPAHIDAVLFKDVVIQ